MAREGLKALTSILTRHDNRKWHCQFELVPEGIRPHSVGASRIQLNVLLERKPTDYKCTVGYCCLCCLYKNHEKYIRTKITITIINKVISVILRVYCMITYVYIGLCMFICCSELANCCFVYFLVFVHIRTGV